MKNIPDKEWLTPEGARLARAERRAKWRKWLLPLVLLFLGVGVLCASLFYYFNR